ncbi:MAG TPA: hypothetical protein VI814_02555 [Candidatus Limnocylindria bacterium]
MIVIGWSLVILAAIAVATVVGTLTARMFIRATTEEALAEERRKG